MSQTSESPHSHNFHQLFDPSSDQLVSLVADRTVAAIIHAWREGREAQIVLTGGRTGLSIAKSVDVALFRATSQSDSESFKDSRLRIWFSDERFVLNDSPDRSDTSLISGFEKSLPRIHFERVVGPEPAREFDADWDLVRVENLSQSEIFELVAQASDSAKILSPKNLQESFHSWIASKRNG